MKLELARLTRWNAVTGTPRWLGWLRNDPRPLHLVLDLSASMACGSPRKADLASELLLTWGLLAWRAHRRVIVSTSSGESRPLHAVVVHRVSDLAGLLDRWRHLEPGGETSLAIDLPHRLGSTRPSRLVVASDMMMPDLARRSVLRTMRGHGPGCMLVQVLAIEDLEPDLRDVSGVDDAETGRSVPLPRGSALARAYAERVASWQRDVVGECRREGVEYARWSGQRSLAGWMQRLETRGLR